MAAVVTQLLNNEQKAGATYKVVIKAADLTETTTDTAQTLELITVEKGSLVTQAAWVLKTGFTDASDTAHNSTTLTLGDGSSVARYSTSKELNTNGTEILAWADSNAVNTAPYAYLAADTIDAVFTCMSGKNLNDLDGGEIWIYFNILHMGR